MSSFASQSSRSQVDSHSDVVSRPSTLNHIDMDTEVSATEAINTSDPSLKHLRAQNGDPNHTDKLGSHASSIDHSTHETQANRPVLGPTEDSVEEKSQIYLDRLRQSLEILKMF